MQTISKEEILDFLHDFPGYRKEGKKRLRDILEKRGYLATLKNCARALREFNTHIEDAKFRRLFFDIETSPNLGLFWRSGYKLKIPTENIIQERSVICVSWKWEGEDKVHTLTWDKGDDKQLLETFVKELNKSDEAIAHNSDRFDIKWLRTRALYHRIPFPTYIKTLDTLKKVRSQFNFQSNRLSYIADFLGVAHHKIKTEYDLWKDLTLNAFIGMIYKDDQSERLREMVEYCEMDVVVLEDVYHAIQDYIKPNSHVGTYEGKLKHTCPTCGSDDVELIRPMTTRAGTIQRHMQCNSCSTDYKISNQAYKKMLDENK